MNINYIRSVDAPDVAKSPTKNCVHASTLTVILCRCIYGAFCGLLAIVKLFLFIIVADGLVSILYLAASFSPVPLSHGRIQSYVLDQ